MDCGRLFPGHNHPAYSLARKEPCYEQALHQGRNTHRLRVALP